MLLTTQDNFIDHEIVKTLDVVSGNTVRSRNIARNFIAGLRTIIGGELPELTEAINESRQIALDRMKEHAEQLGGNAIVGIRFTSAETLQGCVEILAFGTAVKVKPAEMR